MLALLLCLLLLALVQMTAGSLRMTGKVLPRRSVREPGERDGSLSKGNLYATRVEEILDVDQLILKHTCMKLRYTYMIPMIYEFSGRSFFGVLEVMFRTQSNRGYSD